VTWAVAELCMFTPVELELERGWPGRIDGDHVVQLAAQTLQSYFASGSSAREHSRFGLADVLLRAPVLEPPSVRVFEGDRAFRFGNPAAIRSPGASIPRPRGRLDALARVCAIVGGDGALAGWTGLVEWVAPELGPAKDRDFALLLGPVVSTEPLGEFDWEAACAHASENTRLRPGDLVAGPPVALREDVAAGRFSFAFEGLGELHAVVA
jgi:hypothetical protein